MLGASMVGEAVGRLAARDARRLAAQDRRVGGAAASRQLRALLRAGALRTGDERRGKHRGPRRRSRGAAVLRPVGAGFEGNGVSDTKADIEGPDRLRIELQQPAFYWEPTGSRRQPLPRDGASSPPSHQGSGPVGDRAVVGRRVRRQHRRRVRRLRFRTDHAS